MLRANNSQKTQVDRRDVKRETEFVDRVEFRLSVDNKVRPAAADVMC